MRLKILIFSAVSTSSPVLSTVSIAFAHLIASLLSLSLAPNERKLSTVSPSPNPSPDKGFLSSDDQTSLCRHTHLTYCQENQKELQNFLLLHLFTHNEAIDDAIAIGVTY